MAKKKQNKTFAQRAKELTKKYKRADFDPTERRELDEALSQLAQEQEQYKQANGLQTDKNTYPWGGPIGENNIAGSSGYYTDVPVGTNPNVGNTGSINQNIVANYLNPAQLDYSKDAKIKDFSMPDINTYEDPTAYNPAGIEYQNDAVVDEVIMPNIPFDEPEKLPKSADVKPLEPYQSSVIPSLIGMGVETAGNLYLANRANKIADEQLGYTPQQIQASTIDLGRARESARRDYNTGASIAKRNLRTAGNRGAYLSGTGAAMTGLTKAKEQAISGLYGKEADYNAQARAHAAAQNAQISNQGQMANKQTAMQNRLAGEQAKQAYIASAIGSIPQTMRDIGATRQQDALINVMGEDYGFYSDPNRKWYQRPQYQKRMNKGAGFNFNG